MYRYKQVFWVSCVGPGARLVVKVSGGGGGGCSCVEARLFKLFRLYIKWSLVLKHVCAGRGNVTFGVYVTNLGCVRGQYHTNNEQTQSVEGII